MGGTFLEKGNVEEPEHMVRQLSGMRFGIGAVKTVFDSE